MLHNVYISYTITAGKGSHNSNFYYNNDMTKSRSGPTFCYVFSVSIVYFLLEIGQYFVIV